MTSPGGETIRGFVKYREDGERSSQQVPRMFRLSEGRITCREEAFAFAVAGRCSQATGRVNMSVWKSDEMQART